MKNESINGADELTRVTTGQLQKMGILKSAKSQEKENPTPAKRKSIQPDFSNLGPLKPGGTVGFLNFRDGDKKSSKRSKKGSGSDMSDDDDDDDRSIIDKVDDEEDKDIKTNLSPDELNQQRELAEGLRQIKVWSTDKIRVVSGSDAKL